MQRKVLDTNPLGKAHLDCLGHHPTKRKLPACAQAPRQRKLYEPTARHKGQFTLCSQPPEIACFLQPENCSKRRAEWKWAWRSQIYFSFLV